MVLSAQLGQLDNMVAKQRALLRMVSKVAREDLSEAVNAILDAVTNHLQEKPMKQSEMYKMTLDVLKTSNERMWFNISLRLAKIYLDLKNFDSLDSLIADLKESCKQGNGQYDASKSSMLQEVLSLEIQLCAEAKNHNRMKAVYNETRKLNAVINEPRTTAIIREAGGKIYMTEKKWALALDELFESFKSYQESGNTRAKTVLKYVILASILANSEINYAQTLEAKVYQEDK